MPPKSKAKGKAVAKAIAQVKKTATVGTTEDPGQDQEGQEPAGAGAGLFPLHEHGGYAHEPQTSAGPHRESVNLDPDEADDPWLLFHPDLFNAGVSPNHYRFCLERVRAAQSLQGYEDHDELDFTDYTEFIANAPTICRRIEGLQFRYALQMVENMADEEDEERRETEKKQQAKDKKAAAKAAVAKLKQKKKDAANDDDEEEEDEDLDKPDETMPPAVVTARDLLLDRVLVRYMPEVLVWLGHGPKAWKEVRISAAQARLYKTANMTNSAQLLHMSAEPPPGRGEEEKSVEEEEKEEVVVVAEYEELEAEEVD
ncbi:hypothetical protein PG984_003154 [Apiospora sp. TS-2023a]